MEWLSHDPIDSVLASVLSKAKSRPEAGCNSVSAPLPAFTATILIEQVCNGGNPEPPTQVDSAENRAIMSRVVPAGTEIPTWVLGMSAKLVELVVVAVSCLTILTWSMGPPLARVATAKAAPLARITATAIEA